MAASKDDILQSVLKAGIVGAILIAAYLLYKRLFASGTGSGTGTGSGNSSGISGTIHSAAEKLEAGANTVIGKIEQNLKHTPADHFDLQTSKAVNLGLGLAGFGNVIPMQQSNQVKSLVARLQKADVQSVNYFTKSGSTPQINAILKDVDSLPDQEFITVMNAWKTASGIDDLVKSNLAGARIPGTARSRFLSRLHQLNAA